MTPSTISYINKNTELKEDNMKLKTATAQLQEELEKVKAELTQIYINLNNADQIPATSIPAKNLTSTVPTGSITEVQDLLSSTEPKLTNSNEATLQDRLAKEPIKLANSYKIPELIFDI
jgi:seryl-tRNA synthetase